MEIMKTMETMETTRYKLSAESWLDIFNLPDRLINNFEKLWKLHPKEKGKVMIYGKLIKIPRYQ